MVDTPCHFEFQLKMSLSIHLVFVNRFVILMSKIKKKLLRILKSQELFLLTKLNENIYELTLIFKFEVKFRITVLNQEIKYSYRSLTGILTNPKQVFQLGRTPILFLSYIADLNCFILGSNSKVNEKSFVHNIIYVTQIKYSQQFCIIKKKLIIKVCFVFFLFRIFKPLKPVFNASKL
jgi:hypothetical protein